MGKNKRGQAEWVRPDAKKAAGEKDKKKEPKSKDK